MRWADTTLTSYSPGIAGEDPGHAGPAQSPRQNVFPRRLTVQNARGRLTVVRNGAYTDLEASGIGVLVSKRSALARNGRQGGNARPRPGRRKFSVFKNCEHCLTNLRRVAQLERKLDDIVNLLKSSHDAPAEDQESSKPSNSAYPAPSPVSMTQTPSATLCIRPLQEEGLAEEAAAPMPPTRDPLLEHSATSDQNTFSKSDKDTYLTIFKTSMARYFPFVVIDDHISAEELGRTKPFLLDVILVAAFHRDSGRQSALGKEIIEHLSRRMLFDGEKSLDLLQGLLVYISWYCRTSSYRSNELTSV